MAASQKCPGYIKRVINLFFYSHLLFSFNLMSNVKLLLEYILIIKRYKVSKKKKENNILKII